MPKYIVSGYIGFDNFGDEAIAHVLADRLKQDGAESITFISSNPQKTKRIHGVDSCGMLKFLAPLIKSDVLISGGGSLLQDVTSFKSLLYYLSVIYCAVLLGKRLEIYAQGIGPIKSKLGVLLTKEVLKHASKITVRDKKSHELLKSWGIESTLVKDLVFDLELPKKFNKGILGIQLRKFDGIDETFLKELAKEVSLRFSDKKIEILSLQDSIDKDICNKFSVLLKEYGVDSTVYSSMTLPEVIEKISNLEYLIAMRFHAGVVGIKSEVKTMMVNYDPKVEKLAEEYTLPLINIKTRNFSEAFNKLLK